MIAPSEDEAGEGGGGDDQSGLEGRAFADGEQAGGERAEWPKSRRAGRRSSPRS